jgi:hypothetical protein
VSCGVYCTGSYSWCSVWGVTATRKFRSRMSSSFPEFS